MTKTAHVIGNGPSAGFYKPAKGLKILNNLKICFLNSLKKL